VALFVVERTPLELGGGEGRYGVPSISDEVRFAVSMPFPGITRSLTLRNREKVEE
jgi:hypothetical protein